MPPKNLNDCSYKTLKSNQIIEFIKLSSDKGIYPMRKDIEEKFCVDIRTYFGDINKLYFICGLDYKTLVMKDIIKNRINAALKKTRGFDTILDGKKEVINFVIKNVKNGIYPTAKEINNQFHINVYSYFKNMLNLYNESGVRSHFKSKQERIKEIKTYICKKLKMGLYPSKRDLEKDLHLDLNTCFPKWMYNNILINICGSKRMINIIKYKHRSNITIKRFKTKEDGKRKILSYIKNNYKHKKYPTQREIESYFGICLGSYFKSMGKLYDDAKIKYKREPNVLLSKEKEKVLTNIAIKLFEYKGYKINKISILDGNKKEDLLLKNNCGSEIPVEIKAYHKTISLPNRLVYLKRPYQNEYSQLRDYIQKLNSPYGYLVTSTQKIVSKPNKEDKIIIIDGHSLRNFLVECKQRHLIKLLNWVQNTYNSENKNILRDKKRLEIINYLRKNYKKGILIKRIKLEKEFHIDLRTYFNSPKDPYKLAKII